MLLTPRVKVTISLTMTVLAVALALMASKPWSVFAATAMAICTLADALLARYPAPFGRLGRRGFFIGAVAFALAHLHYTLALLMASGMSAGECLRNAALPLALLSGCVALHWWAFYHCEKSARKPGFSVAATLYLLEVSLMCAVAISSFADSGARMLLPAAGACLFFVSDCALIRREYRGLSTRATPYIIWGTYVPAQLCLMLGFFLA